MVLCSRGVRLAPWERAKRVGQGMPHQRMQQSEGVAVAAVQGMRQAWPERAERALCTVGAAEAAVQALTGKIAERAGRALVP